MADKKTIRIGGASGYWGEAAHATRQLIAAGDLDYLVYDYLAEITLSIMARARAANPEMGYAPDFVTATLAPNLDDIASQGIKVVSNAGGVNPIACGQAVRELLAAKGLGLKVAVITGDDLLARADEFHAAEIKEMFSGELFPPVDKVASINAYLGAVPIATALRNGADIVITGRGVDSAVTLGACLAEFDWESDDFNKLAQASVAGHLIECGPQATGGNFTDWQEVGDGFADIGYPLVEMHADASFFLTKPPGTGGVVNVGTTAEQLLYEIGDPQRYLLPDVACNFSAVQIEQAGTDRVRVSGATGSPPTEKYKVSATWVDGYKAAMSMQFIGFDAADKAQMHARAGLRRAADLLESSGLVPFRETNVEVVGAGSQFGSESIGKRREVDLKIAVRHADKRGVNAFIRALSGLGLGAPPGLAVFQAGRPKASPVVRLFSFLLPKTGMELTIDYGESAETLRDTLFDRDKYVRKVNLVLPGPPDTAQLLTSVPLIQLAWGRSGDKGDKANIGIIARSAEYAPWIWAALDEKRVKKVFSHFGPVQVERFYLPGTNAINYLLHDVLGGGGVASIRVDPQGKAYAQILLHTEIPIPTTMAENIR